MSRQITEEKAQGGITPDSTNICSKIVESTLQSMDISDCDTPPFAENVHSNDSKLQENYKEVVLENTKKNDILIGNEKKLEVAEECVDENLISKVNNLNISQPEISHFEVLGRNLLQGTSAQDPMSLSLENFLRYGSKPNLSNEDLATLKMKRLGFLSKEDYDNEFISSDLDSESESDFDSEDEDKAASKNVENSSIKKRKVQEESWLSVLGSNKQCPELPDISSLELNNREEFMHMGNLQCVIDKIVTIAGLPNLPSYDLDTLLFLDEGQKVLGFVYDVMGPVSAPVYIVHMDSAEAIKNLQLQKGTNVFCAPKSKYTKYVFLEELMKMRGSDAAWSGEAEVPSDYQDCSEEEQDIRSKVSKIERKRQHSQERFKKFERDMNRANERDTRIHRMADAHRQNERLTGMTSIEQQIFEHRIRLRRSSSSNNPPEIRRGRSHFRNTTQRVVNSLSELQNWGPVTSNLPNLSSLLASSPTFDPSIPPPNFGTSPRVLPSSGASVFPPFLNLPPSNNSNRSSDSNRSTNRSTHRQNSMPGPSNDAWSN